MGSIAQQFTDFKGWNYILPKMPYRSVIAEGVEKTVNTFNIQHSHHQT